MLTCHKLRGTITSLCFLLFTWTVIAQSPKTFYIGHSLSDQIPDMVQSLSNDHAEVDFSWVYQSIPGSPLRYNWDRKYNMDYSIIDPNYYGFYDGEHGLPAGNFDVLVLTESVPRSLAIIDETYAYADSFFQYATFYNPGIQIYLYEDWHCLLSGTPTGCDYDVDSNPWRQRLDDDLAMWESVVDTLNQRHNPSNPVCLIPVGQGLSDLYDSIQVGAIPGVNQIEDLFSDNIHLTDVGKYFVACMHFAVIHKTSPVGLTNQLQVWWGGDFDAPSSELALKFQEIAWSATINYPRSCVNDVVSVKEEVAIDLNISPNPTRSQFTIGGLKGSSTVEVLNADGKIVDTVNTSDESVDIDLQSVPAGLYFIKVRDSNEQWLRIEKIVKI